MPDYIVSTGDYLNEWMEENDILPLELSQRLNETQGNVNNLLDGKMPLSESMATKLEKVTGIPAHIWMQHEELYRKDLIRNG